MPTSAIKFEFGEEFQTKIAACVFRDVQFNKRVLDLIEPTYFEKASEAAIVNIISKYHKKYSVNPSIPSLMELIKADIAAKIIRKDLVDDIKVTIKELVAQDISDVEFVVDQVSTFARHKGMELAALKYVELLERKEYDKAAKVIADASAISALEGNKEYDFFGDDELNDRERRRNDRLAGVRSGISISTGIRGLDKRLFHNGWGKGEYYSLMGPPKIGKSISLAFFAQMAAMNGNNVLFVTLEVSKDITAERIDSSITGIAMSELEKNIINAKGKIQEAKAKAGRLFIEEYPSGTMTPAMLSRIIQKFKSKGIKFDMVVVDYADIMAPNNRTSDPIENSKSVYLDLRALAQIEFVVLLSATQTNREGAKAITAKMEHAAEDFNRIRIPDLVISINRTDEEKAKGEARLYFAASRNQKGDFTIFVRQDLEAMCFIKDILKIE